MGERGQANHATNDVVAEAMKWLRTIVDMLDPGDQQLATQC